MTTTAWKYCELSRCFPLLVIRVILYWFKFKHFVPAARHTREEQHLFKLKTEFPVGQMVGMHANLARPQELITYNQKPNFRRSETILRQTRSLLSDTGFNELLWRNDRIKCAKTVPTAGRIDLLDRRVNPDLAVTFRQIPRRAGPSAFAACIREFDKRTR